MPDFHRRSAETELMDMEDISFEEFHHCLRSLEIINILTLAYRPTLRWLKKCARNGQPVTIIDAGCGSGDMLRRIEKLFRRAGTPAFLTGVDLNPWSRKSAQLLSSGSSIVYETSDVFSFHPERQADFILSSLFAHHLSDEKIVDFLRWMERQAQKGWFINDLHRHPIPYYFIKGATALLSSNRLIRNDAAVSVARSFSKADWHRLLDQAGLSGQARVEKVFPFRLCVSRLKS